MRKPVFCTIAILLFFIIGDARHNVPQEPLDGRNRIFRDELLDNLVGDWKLTRKIRAQSLEKSGQSRVRAQPSVLISSHERRRESPKL
jgi:hypothetical protein